LGARMVQDPGISGVLLFAAALILTTLIIVKSS
jgi:hypothetical protein